jgi:hypothetical protein
MARSLILYSYNPLYMLKRGVLFLLPLFLLLATPCSHGLRAQKLRQANPGQANPPSLTNGEKKAVVDSLCKLLDAYYIYPTVGTKMASFLSHQLSQGSYDTLSDPQSLAIQLGKDLLSISHDEHFNIVFDPAWVSRQRDAISKKDSLNLLSLDSSQSAQRNFGFAEVRILPGNLGYLNLTNFDNPRYAGETAAAAMQLLCHTNALIIDLRNNGGGYSTMVQLLASYLFDVEPVHIVDIYSREGSHPGDNTANKQPGNSTQDWTLPYVPGHRLSNTAVYILTNHQTFSAAESFSYFLKNRKRATIVGETTGGGAHPVDLKIITDRFYIFMPTERPVDPITGTDWEGVGVKPDVEVPAKDAFLTAQQLALEKELASRPEDLPLAWALAAVKVEQHPVILGAGLLQSYIGVYGNRKITFEGGGLFFQRAGAGAYAMVPLGADLFMIRELPYLRIQFIVENGKTVGVKRLYDDGRSVQDKKETAR